MVYCWPWAAERHSSPRHTANERPRIFIIDIYSVNARAPAAVTGNGHLGLHHPVKFLIPGKLNLLSVHGGGNNPTNAKRNGPRQDGRGKIALLADLLPQIQRRQLQYQREGDDENDDAEAAENQAVDHRIIGHRWRWIHSLHCSSPAPDVHETSMISISGCTRRAFSRARSMENGTYGSRSTLLSTIRSA